MVIAQDGKTNLFDGLNLKPTLKVYAKTSGTLKQINCEKLGNLVGQMGATRQKITDKINYNVGIKTFHKLNNKINKNDVIFEIYATNKSQAQKFAEQFEKCYTIK
jgi:thymidine phosphorylase